MQVENRPVIDLSAENARQICDRLQPGDLIFRHGTKKGVDATFIRVFQQKVGGYSDVASNVTHVAIYAGQGKVIHAVPPMVCEDDLASYFAGSKNPLHSDTVPQRVSILLPAHLFVQPGLIDLSLT